MAVLARRPSAIALPRPGSAARQVASFAAIGVVSTAAYAALYVALRAITEPATANAVALLVTAVGNTAANRRLTFAVRDRVGAMRDQVGGFIASGGPCDHHGRGRRPRRGRAGRRRPIEWPSSSRRTCWPRSAASSSSAAGSPARAARPPSITWGPSHEHHHPTHRRTGRGPLAGIATIAAASGALLERERADAWALPALGAWLASPRSSIS